MQAYQVREWANFLIVFLSLWYFYWIFLLNIFIEYLFWIFSLNISFGFFLWNISYRISSQRMSKKLVYFPVSFRTNHSTLTFTKTNIAWQEKATLKEKIFLYYLLCWTARSQTCPLRFFYASIPPKMLWIWLCVYFALMTDFDWFFTTINGNILINYK